MESFYAPPSRISTPADDRPQHPLRADFSCFDLAVVMLQVGANAYKGIVPLTEAAGAALASVHPGCATSVRP